MAPSRWMLPDGTPRTGSRPLVLAPRREKPGYRGARGRCDAYRNCAHRPAPGYLTCMLVIVQWVSAGKPRSTDARLQSLTPAD